MARALHAHDGVGALDICVKSVSSLGLDELNNEGEYEETQLNPIASRQAASVSTGGRATEETT